MFYLISALDVPIPQTMYVNDNYEAIYTTCGSSKGKYSVKMLLAVHMSPANRCSRCQNCPYITTIDNADYYGHGSRWRPRETR